MNFDDFNSMDLAPANGFGFVYVLCWVNGHNEIPFYVGETQAIWGRMNDYHWAEFDASTDFRVGEAVKYLNTKKLRIVAKYRVSADRRAGRRKEEAAIIRRLKDEGRVLLNDCPGYNYRTSTPDKERIKVQTCIDKILAASGAQI